MKRSELSTTNMTYITDSEAGTASLHSKIRHLQAEVLQLNRILEIKDAALEEIEKLFKEEFTIAKKNAQVVERVNTLSLLPRGDEEGN